MIKKKSKELKRVIQALKFNAKYGIDIRTTLLNLGFWEVDSAKRVVELIKDNSQLIDECRELEKKWLQATDEGTSWAHRKKLEKENADLQNKIDNLQKYLDTKNCYRKCAETLTKLSKAKYHIQKLLDCLRQDTNDTEANHYVIKYMNDAEQFLKEEE